MAMATTFSPWVADEQRQREERTARRAREQQTGEPEDDMGRYWLERTAVLEHIAAAAEQLVRAEPGLCSELRELLDRLERIPAPVCRAGDHAHRP